MLSAIGLVPMRDGSEWGVALAFAAVGGSFLVSYTRARAEAIGLKADVGRQPPSGWSSSPSALRSPPSGRFLYVVAVLTATAWLTVLQRILFVRKQLADRPGSTLYKVLAV